MKKVERVAGMVDRLDSPGDPALSPFYRGYFQCFSAGKYYDAHDVLEQLWLAEPGENFAYFKGLIQIAGAFVHLQKQFLRPDHPKDGRRLKPAVRLFHLGLENLRAYRPSHLHFDVESLCQLSEQLIEKIERSHFTLNPWNPSLLPQIGLLSS